MFRQFYRNSLLSFKLALKIVVELIFVLKMIFIVIETLNLSSTLCCFEG